MPDLRFSPGVSRHKLWGCNKLLDGTPKEGSDIRRRHCRRHRQGLCKSFTRICAAHPISSQSSRRHQEKAGAVMFMHPHQGGQQQTMAHMLQGNACNSQSLLKGRAPPTAAYLQSSTTRAGREQNIPAATTGPPGQDPARSDLETMYCRRPLSPPPRALHRRGTTLTPAAPAFARSAAGHAMGHTAAPTSSTP